MTVAAYIEELKLKPRAVRERIAVGASLGITGVIAAGWIAVMVVTNPFADTGTTVADENAPDFSQAIEGTRSGFQNLLGGVGAAGNREDESDIRIVDTSTKEPKAEQATVIPF